MSQQSFEADNPYLHQMSKMFDKRVDKEMELIWNMITLLIYKDATAVEIPYLYEKFGIQDFLILCQVLGGKTVRFPTRKEVESHLLTALLYYDREILKLDWDEIHKKYPEIDISAIKFAIKINNLDSFVKTRMQELMRDVKQLREEQNNEQRKSNP